MFHKYLHSSIPFGVIHTYRCFLFIWSFSITETRCYSLIFQGVKGSLLSVIDKDYELYKSRGVILLQVCDSYKQVAYILFYVLLHKFSRWVSFFVKKQTGRSA